MSDATKPPRVPAYRLHKPSRLAVVRLNGKDHYLGQHGSPESHQEYRRVITEWLVRHQQSRTEETSTLTDENLTINELLLAYWKFAEKYYVKDGRPTGEHQAIRYSMKPLANLYGRKLVHEFGPLELKSVRENMIDAGLARTLINARIKRIRRIFKWGVENQFVTPTLLQALQAVAPLKKGRCRAKESGPVKPVLVSHVDAALPHVSRQVCTMIELQLLTGMRPCEVTIMRGCDIETTQSIWSYRPDSHKTDHLGFERIIYLGPKAQEVIKPFLKVNLHVHLFRPKDAIDEFNQRRRENRKTPMTPSQAKRGPKRKPRKSPGEHYTTDSYGYAIAKACNKAGIPRWSPNRLRHNAATSLRKEYGIEVARIILGHRSPTTTEVYAELDRTKAIQVMAEVG